MNKKRVIFAVTIFVALGLFLFTFANPKDEEEATNNDIVKPTTNDVKPVVEEPVKEEKENVEEPAVTNTTVLEAPRNNQTNRFNNVVTEPTTNVPTVDPKPTEEPKEEEKPVVEPTVVYHKVQFIGFNNEIISVQDVEDGKDAVAPEITNVIKDNIVYTYGGWDSDYTNIKAKTTIRAIYEITKITASIVLDDGSSLGTIDLKVSESLFDAITNPAVVTTDQEVIESLVDGDLPTADVLNYKYIYTSLEYVPGEGFVITASLVVDEEALARNTVVLTYVIDDNAKFANGTKKIETKTTNGYNAVELPKVYVNGKEVHVNWADTNGEVKEGYTSSMTLTAKIDRNGPVITLIGEKNRTVFETTGSYVEEGFTVEDNYTTFTNNDVKITIKNGNTSVNKVDYSKPGTYTITYTAVDTEGNVGTATRTITVKKVELVKLELSSYEGTYFVGDRMETVTVTAVYNNNTTKVLSKKTCSYGNYNCTDGYKQDKEFNSSSTGTKSITYTYGGKSATYNYTVKKVELVKLELSKYQGTYFIGDRMETVTVTAVYNNDTTKVLSKKTCSYGNYNCTDGYKQDKEFNSSSTGTKSITYTYGGKSATYNYTVKKVELVKLELSKYQGTYTVGDNMETITVTAVYNNDTTKVLSKKTCSYGNYNCTDGYKQDKEFNSSSTGTKSITYTYEGKSATYNYTVNGKVAVKLELSKTTGNYIVGDKMDSFDVYVVYSNGTKEKVNNYTITGFETKKENVGNGKVATITYNGLTAQYTYDVKYHAEIGRSQIFFTLVDCYLVFDIPSTTTVTSIVSYDENGVSHNIPIPSGSTNKIMISKEHYDIIHSMTGNNANQKLLVTYNVNGETVVSTYTKVVVK